jgi:hypothetical protein
VEDNGNKIEFYGFGEASNDYLWFGISKIWEKTENSISSSSCLAEWEFNKPPASRLIGNAQPVDWITVDAANRRVFIFNPAENQIYDFIKMENEYAPFNEFEFMDFDPNYGLLASKTSARGGERNYIAIFDFATGDKKIIAKGLSAVWGSGGYVYYCDSRKQLWRCSADGNGLMKFSSGIVKDINSVIGPPKVSHDRTMLAYDYSYYNNDEDVLVGTALIDLKTHEYIILENESFRYNEMAWLIKEGKVENGLNN